MILAEKHNFDNGKVQRVFMSVQVPRIFVYKLLKHLPEIANT
jgi:hypothetical protein